MRSSLSKEELIQETALLYKGKNCRYLKEGVEIIFSLSWGEEDFPQFKINSVRVIRDTTFLEKLMLSASPKLVDLDWRSTIIKTEDYQAFDARIRKVLNEEVFNFSKEIVPLARFVVELSSKLTET